MQAKEYILDARKRNQEIKLGPIAETAREDEQLKVGAIAVVRIGGVLIDLEVLDHEEGDTWVGHIRGWEGHAGRYVKGLEVGDVLRFHEPNVFELYHGGQRMPTASSRVAGD